MRFNFDTRTEKINHLIAGFQMAYYKTYKGKLLGPYNYDRPTHLFTEKDVARIAKKVAERTDGNGFIKVFAAVAIALGFSKLFCHTARALKTLLSVHNFIKEIGVTLAFGGVINTVIAALLGLQAMPALPVTVKAFLAIIIALLYFLNKLSELLPNLISDYAFLHDLSETMNNLCNAVSEQLDDVKSGLTDAIGGMCEDYGNGYCDDATEKLKQAKEALRKSLQDDGERAWEELGLPEYPKWWQWL